MMTDFEQQIGPFRLYSEIGRTPISNRYRATDSRSGQTVVVHMLTAESAQQPQLVEQFLTIGRQAMRLRHPGIIPVVDAGEAQGFVYIATPWMRGHSLAERLRRTGHTLDLETIAYILNALAAILDYAHSQGFVHGHITPEQIYITDENVILLDGFAEAVRVHAGTAPQNGEHSDQSLSSPLVFISPFIAPEQTKSEQTFDFRADIYSLGAVLYTMLLGRPPFTAETPDELLLQVAEKQPTPPESINPALPAAMIYVLKLVLAKEPAARYAKASEFATAFLQSSQWRPTTPMEELADAPERRGLATIILLPLAAVLLLIILGAGLGWFGERLAFLRSTGDTGIIAQLRGLVSPTDVAIELTAAPLMLTPLVQETETPTPLSSPALTQTGAVEIAQIISNTTSITATLTPPDATGIATPTVASGGATTAITLTSTDITATIPLSAALAVTPTVSVTNSNAASPVLIIDPLGLLNGTVTAGDVIINGTAEPGALIQLQVNGRTSGSTVTKSSGTWSLIIGLDQPGDYEITAQVLDSTGKVAAVAQQTITIGAALETPTAVMTATTVVTAVVTATATPTSRPTNTTTPTVRPSLTATSTNTAAPTPTPSHTPQPTATNTPRPTVTNTAQPTATNTPRPTVTNTAQPTVTNTPQPTATTTPRPTVTKTLQPTASNTPVPTNTLLPPTNTPRPTVTHTPLRPTATNTLRPTVTNTAPPTTTSTPVPTNTLLPPTNTPRPTVTHTPLRPTASNTPRPTVTNTPQPTASNTPRPTVTNTAQPTATNTPRPTVTNTAQPTATNTPRPTVTNTPQPTSTNTPVPTATNTLRVTATNTSVPPTNTPVPTATNTLPPPTATNTSAPTNTPAPPTNTPSPTATNTPAPTPTPTAPSGSVELVSPGNGESGNGQQRFTWSANFTPSEGYAFELVFWKPGQDPMGNGFGMAAPTMNLNVTLDLDRLDEQLGDLFDTGEYDWGILLVRTTPAYERIKYLGGSSRFIYYRSGGPSSDGQSSGE